MRRLLLALSLAAGPALADEFRGTVTEVDGAEQRLLLDTGRVLVVDPGTDVFRDGAVVTLDEVEPGDEVRASFDGLGQLRSLELVGEDEPEEGFR